MPIDVIEGFDYYPNDVAAAGVGFYATWIRSGGGGAGFQTGRFGAKAIRIGSSRPGSTFYTKLFTPTSQFGIGFAFKVDTSIGNFGVTGNWFMSISDNNGAGQVEFRINNIGQLMILIGGQVRILSPRQILQTTWHYVELRCILNDVGGKIELFIDGESQGEYTGDTRTGLATVSRIVIGDNEGTGVYTGAQFDDLYMVIDEYVTLGESRIQLLEPSSDVDVDWTGNPGGGNYANIDDSSTDGDATYNYSNTPGAKDLFGTTQITVNPDTIHAIGTVLAARKEDSGTRTIRSIVKSGPNTGNGESRNLTTDYIWQRDVYVSDPLGGGQWSKARVNALNVGYELVL